MINWGIIGCGDVAEVKSGPAFNKVPNSKLVAVMRRDAAKAADFAKRHGVEKWYDDAEKLLSDPQVNAVYIATPPLQHEGYALAALAAGKFVYVEKPLTATVEQALRLQHAVTVGHKLVVAHYRRQQPLFLKVKELLHTGAIGEIRFVDLRFFQAALSAGDLQQSGKKWRVDPAISGGGLFHDLAPHQLDLMLYFFGDVKHASGFSANQMQLYPADDIVSANIVFNSGVIFNGLWCFSVPESEQSDVCTIVGSKGKISFPVFGEPKINLTTPFGTSTIQFDKLQHVQQPMIATVVDYFLNLAPNPCPISAGVSVMQLMQAATCAATQSFGSTG